MPNRQPNAGKSSIAPKPANPQTKPQASPAKRMTENKISNPSFNKGHGFSSNLAADSIKEKIKMFENNTSFSFNRESSFSSVKEPAKQEPRTSVKANSQMAEDKISNPSFNKGHDFSFNLAANSIKKKIKMFENNTSSNPSSKVLSGSIKKALNRNNFLLKTPPLK